MTSYTDLSQEEPPTGDYYLVKYEGNTGIIHTCVCIYSEISVHAFKDSPRDKRWYAFPNRTYEIKTVVQWMHLPE